MTIADLQTHARATCESFFDPHAPRILIGASTCGKAAGADDLKAAVQHHLTVLGLDIEVCEVGCLGLCYAEPLMEVHTPATPPALFGNVTPEQVGDILDACLVANTIPEDSALAIMDDTG